MAELLGEVDAGRVLATFSDVPTARQWLNQLA